MGSRPVSGCAAVVPSASACQIGPQRAVTGSEWAPSGLTQTDLKEFAMITPRELLDTSIGQLWTLARFLGEQLGEGMEGAEPTTAEARACHEILRSLRVLIVRLEAADHGIGGDIDPPLAARHFLRGTANLPPKLPLSASCLKGRFGPPVAGNPSQPQPPNQVGGQEFSRACSASI